MESEPVPTSSVLFDADGTQLPDPLPVLPDALTGPEHSQWADDIPQIAPIPLPPMPDGRAMREAIAAVLGEDPAAMGSAAAQPDPQAQTWYEPQAQSAYGQSSYGQSSYGQSAYAPPAHGPPGAGPYRPLVRVPSQPTRSAPRRAQSPARLRAVAPIAERADLRRRIGLDSAKQLQNRSSGGVRIGCVIALIIFGIIAFNIVAGIVQAVAGLFS